MEKEQLVIVGASGFGREVMWQLAEVNYQTDAYELLGFVDDAVELQGKTVNGYSVIGDTKWLTNYPNKICAVVCIGNSEIRKNVVQQISENKNIRFPNIVANDVQLSEHVQLGKGCIICLSNIFTVNIAVGDFVIVNLDCTIGHDAVLEDYVTLYPSVNVSGNVRIGTCAEIGTGTNIIQGKNIGEHSIVGAGSVVVKDIPANCTAVGLPAIPIKFHQ